MKTIHKKNKLKPSKASKEFKALLVEDPKGHHLLSERVTSYSNFILDLISIKSLKDQHIKSNGLLASSISLCLSLLLVIGVFEWRFVENVSSVNLELNIQDFDDLLDVPQTEQIQKPPVQVSIPKIIEVDDEEIIEEIEVDLDIEMTEETRIEKVVFSEGNEGIIPEEKADEIFTIVEEQPSPKGGIKAFYQFVSSNLEYPQKARRMGLEGRVFVEFVVEKDGSLTDVKIARGIGGGCDEEAIRVISSAPKWHPGKQRGRAVRVRMVMPIMFKILER